MRSYPSGGIRVSLAILIGCIAFLGVSGESIAACVSGAGCATNSCAYGAIQACTTGACTLSCDNTSTVTPTVTKARCGAGGTDCPGSVSMCGAGTALYGAGSVAISISGAGSCNPSRDVIVCESWIECVNGTTVPGCIRCSNPTITPGTSPYLTGDLICSPGATGDYQYVIEVHDITGLGATACNTTGTCPGSCNSCSGNCNGGSSKSASCCVNL